MEEQSGVPPPQQRLIFSGRQMYVLLLYQLFLPPFTRVCRQDDKTARDFGITAGAVLHLVLALRGGL